MTMHASPSIAGRFQQIQPHNIPELLRKLPRWLCWKAGQIKATGKFDKSPVDPITGYKINGRDPANWLPFAQALHAYFVGSADGIGFALSDQHPINIDGIDFYVTVADFDQCGARMDELRRLWRELREPLTEVSPSGAGLHMWGLSRLLLKGGNAGEGRELYSGGRFVTMTGVSAVGTFGECLGFADLQNRWFPPKALQVDAPRLPSVMATNELASNVVLGPASDNWFNRLSPVDRTACLAEILQLPVVVALADTQDSAPSPNWRTVVAACVRSGAPGAYDLCRAWAQTSGRFTPDNFDLRWRSYARG